MAVKASIANTLLGLKKAGSTSCLAPPNAGTGVTSRSLPPSPCASRKVESPTDYDTTVPLPWEEKSAKINRDFSFFDPSLLFLFLLFFRFVASYVYIFHWCRVQLIYNKN